MSSFASRVLYHLDRVDDVLNDAVDEGAVAPHDHHLALVRFALAQARAKVDEVRGMDK
jgi:hypothetical protein